MPSLVNLDHGATVARILVIHKGKSDGPETMELVRRLRPQLPAVAGDLKPIIGGVPAVLLDLNDELDWWLPRVILLVLVITFLVLMLLMRSLLLPLKAVLLNGLSVAPTYGALVLVFQEGYLSHMLGFTPIGYLESPIVIIYFSSKQNVLMAIMRELLEALAEVIRGLAERTDLPAPAVLRQAMADCFTLVSQESRLIEAVYLKANYSLPSQLLEQPAPMLLPVITLIIERGVREGSLTVTHPRVAADFRWTVGYRLFEMMAQQQMGRDTGTAAGPPAPTIAELHSAFWEFVAQGLGVLQIPR
jgi:AcrR family transcriptional regulator